MKTGVYNRLRWQIAGERWGQYQTPLLLAFPLPRSLSLLSFCLAFLLGLGFGCPTFLVVFAQQLTLN